MSTHHRLPDTRAYPTEPVKNELLLHATNIANHASKAQTTLARETLQVEVAHMLAQNHYLNLSVALALAPNAEVYRVLWQSLADVLAAHQNTEVQWLALPVVVVGGANQAVTLPDTVPIAALAAALHQQPWATAWASIHWAPHLLSAADLGHIKAHQWFAAKQNPQAAADFLVALPNQPMQVDAGQSVQVVYALGYAGRDIQAALNTSWGEAALPLMQVWQTHLATPGATLFTNPLPPLAPTLAMREGSAMRLRMACDVFTTNAVRAIRLQSPRVGVVIAAQTGGRLLFGFNATDAAFELAPQVFAWPLTPGDNIDTIVQQFIDLLAECQVENIRLLHEALTEADALPSYAQAIHMLGHNPLFADSH